jgi:uncharacterized protein (TIGR02231 family)
MMISLPITKVVILEDRAQVERRGEVTLVGPATRLELTGLSPVAVDRSLQVEVDGGGFIDGKFERTWREQPRGGLAADATALRRRAAGLENEVRAAKDLVVRLELRVELLAATRADVLRAIAESAGHGGLDAAGCAEQLGTLSARQASDDEQLCVARATLEHRTALLREANEALAVSEAPASTLDCRLVLNLSGEGRARVRVSYLVPCAVWRPSYRASLVGSTVLLEAEAVIWQRTQEDWNDVQVQLSTARPTLGTAPPLLTEDRLRTRLKLEDEKRVVDVALREEAVQSAGEVGGRAELPGLDDGGEARLLQVAAKTTVPSDGQPHRVPLFSFETTAELAHVCPAELTSAVSLVARFSNESGQVLLAGPVDLVRQSGFVGRSVLKFAAPGERLQLSFGSDDGLRVVRSIQEKVEEARLTGRRTTTTRVTLYVSNARPESATVVLEERVPISEVREVEIRVLPKECSPQPAPLTSEGFARLALELPPNGTRTATFAWELSAAAKVAGA